MRSACVAPLVLSLVACGEVAGSDLAEDPEAFQGVVAFEERTLAFEMTGRVLEVAVQEGDTVEAGAILARLDDTLPRLDRDARAAEAQAAQAELALLLAGSRPEDVRAMRAQRSEWKARLALAKQELARITRLTRKGAATAAALDEAKTQVATTRAELRNIESRLARLTAGARAEEIDAAQARLQAARAVVRAADERIARHVLRAEAPGVVLDRYVEPSELTRAAAPVVTLADVSHPYVDVFVPVGRMDEIHVGTPFEVRVDAFDGSLDGHVEHVARVTEYTPHDLFSPRERPNLVIRVRVRIEDPDRRLHAGLPAFARPKKDASDP